MLVIGDVNPGAEVSSDGDVMVWGRLRGVVHAGAKGNVRAIVAALDLEPTQLRIADVMTIGPDPRPGQPGKWFWKRSATKRPRLPASPTRLSQSKSGMRPARRHRQSAARGLRSRRRAPRHTERSGQHDALYGEPGQLIAELRFLL